MDTNKHELLFKELSYQVQGAAIEVRKNFGAGHKESLYQNALAEELTSRSIKFEKEKAIKIYSPKTGKYIGLYRPDFVIEDKIILEIKAVTKIPRLFLDQIFDYLRNSEFELGYFINFASPKLYIKRVIYTNDRKPFLKKAFVALGVLFVLFSVCSRTQAAVLYSAAANQDVYEGQTFGVDWFLDTEGQSINSLDLRLNFSKDVLEGLEATTGNSVINLWIKNPLIDHKLGAIELTGGITNGINSNQVPIFHSVFQTTKSGMGSLTLNPDSKVLLNDGFGTPETLKFKNVLFNIYPENFIPVKITSSTHPDPNIWYLNNDVEIQFPPKPGTEYSFIFSSNLEIIPDDQTHEVPQTILYPARPDGTYYFKLNSKIGPSTWQEAAVFRVQIDATPPELFEPLIGSDPALFSGKPFISFSTVDKTSGISHYKVKVGLFGTPHETQSPYKLYKPLVGDWVVVDAVDLAGNVRQVSVAWEGYISTKTFEWILILIGLVAIALGFKKYKQ